MFIFHKSEKINRRVGLFIVFCFFLVYTSHANVGGGKVDWKIDEQQLNNSFSCSENYIQYMYVFA